MSIYPPRKPRKPNPAAPPNIITDDDTAVCPDHYRRLRKGCNWRKTGLTYEACEFCADQQSHTSRSNSDIPIITGELADNERTTIHN